MKREAEEIVPEKVDLTPEQYLALVEMIEKRMKIIRDAIK